MTILFGSHFYYANHVWFWCFQSIVTHIAALILVIQLVVQTIYVFQDLCTKARRSVSFRQSKPLITKTYILMVVCSAMGVFLYSLAIVLVIPQQWTYFSDACLEFLIVSSDCWIAAKEFMYFSFLLRLHIVYGETQYKYSVNKLCIVAILSSILTISNLTFTVFFSGTTLIFYPHYPLFLHCSAVYPLWHVMLVGGLDVVMAIGFLYAFIMPLRDVIKVNLKSSRNIHDKAGRQKNFVHLQSLGRKSLILTTTAVSSTLFLLLLILFTSSLFFTGVDCVLNNFCIMFMTPYYSDERYYKRFCCGVIKIYQRIFENKSNRKTEKKLKSIVSMTDTAKDPESTCTLNGTYQD
eukprot:228711_1